MGTNTLIANKSVKLIKKTRLARTVLAHEAFRPIKYF